MQDRHYPATGLDGLIEAIEQLFISKFDINIHAESEHVKSICASCIEENVVQFLQTVHKILLDVNKDAFLQWLWSNRENKVWSEIDFELLDSGIQADLAGVLKQFETSEAYLEGVENHVYFTKDLQSDAKVMDRINIDDGTTFIGKLQKQIEDEMQKCDQRRFPILN
ncbi:Hypothetical predicted protein [Mytilus galloprovincialis]|uniref:Uncharacterized protein n=1 Tax=Mytilus galloprovincialis TaxID=29158 RepID=A0A8B6FK65_MYTGA|nr:Hypothetical predicted protein [Mytilus galloprovincialis]